MTAATHLSLALPPRPVPLALAGGDGIGPLPHDPHNWAEIKRIIDLPILKPMSPEEIEVFNELHIQANAFEHGFRLSPAQAEALAVYETYGAVFAKLCVGEGKTLLGLMVAAAAYRKGLHRILLLVPPEVMGQLIFTDIPWARSRVEINYPIHVLGGKPIEYRRALCASRYKGLYIMPYSLLSTKDTSENLTALAPQLVIADECHRLANHSAARTRRFISMLKAMFDGGSPAEMVDMSGTITSKSIKDYYHLMKWCLHDRMPLPRSERMANDWAMLIDAEASKGGAMMPGPMEMGPILPLVDWAKKHFPAEAPGLTRDVYGFRRAFELRLNSAPGVVAVEGTGIGTSLIIQNMPAPEHEKHKDWKKLSDLIEKVDRDWTTPNGDEIDHAIHKWKWLYELSCGFYNELTWPTPEVYAKRKKLDSIGQAADILERAVVHHGAGQAYTRILRPWLEDKSKPGIDTPNLCGLDMVRNGAKNVGSEMYEAWRDWKDLDFEGRPDRDSRAVRVCSYKVDAAVAWAKELGHEEGNGGVVWVWHHEMGEWIMEAMKAAAIDAVYCPAGHDDEIRAMGDPNLGGKGDRVVVASILAHREGKNLQAFQHMYVMQWPRMAKMAEQLIGRLHRRGQKADELVVTTNHTLPFDCMNMAACLNDSLYIHQSTGSKQKLIYANYDPLPWIFPPAILIQRGLDATRLDAEQERAMHEKFGDYQPTLAGVSR